MTARRVLVIDGDPGVREAIRGALAEDGIVCEVAESGEQGVKLAEDPGVGAVLLGVRLPDQSGIDVLRALREQRGALRVIALGSAAEQALILEALRRGATDYLATPIHDEELRLAVRRALEATETATRFEALCARLERLADDFSAFGAGATSDDPDAAAESLAERAAELLGAGRTSLLLLDGEGALRVAAIRGGDHAASDLGRVPIADSVAGLALDAEEGLRIDDVDRDARCAGRARRGRYGSRSALLVPLRGASGALGVLCATERPESSPFTAEDLVLARLLALAAAPRFEPAPAGVGTDDALRVDLARGIGEALTTQIEPLPLLQAALQQVADLLPAAPVSLYLVDARAGTLALEARSEGARADRPSLPRDRGLVGDVLRTGRLVAEERPEAEPLFAADVDSPEDGVAGPLYCVPIAIRGRALGVVRAFVAPGRGVSSRTAEVISTALSAAVRNVLLYRSLLESIDDLARARREASTGGAGTQTGRS
jgi:DNA-binding response OmpR family regulator